jgi:GT2 family glycosyltransferase
MSATLSALFVNYDSWSECVDAVQSLLEHSPSSTQVIIVDNHSPTRDPDREAVLRELCESTGGALILHDDNGGYAAGVNLAYTRANGDHILVCNPDLIFHAGTVPRMLDYLCENETVGVAAPEGYWDRDLECKLPPSFLPTMCSEWRTTWAHLRPSSLRRYNHARIHASLRYWTTESSLDLPMFSGCCFMMPRSVIDDIGFFDERFPLYFEDSDLSRRVTASGRRIVQVANSAVTHLYNRSGSKNYAAAMRRHRVSRDRYFGKHYGPHGRVLAWACRYALQTGWGKKRRERFKPIHFESLETEGGRPILPLPSARGRLVIEASLDPWFFLPGAICPTGDRWSSGDALFGQFPDEIWFRLLDVYDGSYEELGLYEFTQSTEART